MSQLLQAIQIAKDYIYCIGKNLYNKNGAMLEENCIYCGGDNKNSKY